MLLPRDAFGEGMPETDLVLARHERILLPGGVRAEGAAADGLVPAERLGAADAPQGVEAAGAAHVAFFCEGTELVQVGGLWREALNPFDRDLCPERQARRAEMLALFPDLVNPAGSARS